MLSGIPGDECIPKVQAIEKDTGVSDEGVAYGGDGPNPVFPADNRILPFCRHIGNHLPQGCGGRADQAALGVILGRKLKVGQRI